MHFLRNAIVIAAGLCITEPSFSQDATLSGDAVVELNTVIGSTDNFTLKLLLNPDPDQPEKTEIADIPFMNVDGVAVFEGDMVLGSTEELGLLQQLSGTDFEAFDAPEQPVAVEDQVRALGLRGLAIKRVFNGQVTRWPGGVVPYVVGANFPDAGRLTAAMNYLTQNTNVRFVQRTNESNYVVFTPMASGCSSRVGLVGGAQAIKLEPNCSDGNVVHEIMHALGIGHEQTRNDRDNVVTIDYANIIDQYEGNYNKSPGRLVDHGTYDFDSLMHYPAKGGFNVDPSKPSIILKQGVTMPPGVTMGQRSHLSAGDIALLNDMYP